jgi:hypothetical protein
MNLWEVPEFLRFGSGIARAGVGSLQTDVRFKRKKARLSPGFPVDKTSTNT